MNTMLISNRLISASMKSARDIAHCSARFGLMTESAQSVEG